MDTKAMAKSKRLHSQHHSKKYRPNSASKPPSNVASSVVKDPNLTSTKAQVGVKSVQSKAKSSLPGNWDRYEEEPDSDSEILAGVDPSRYSDVVKPKSKGADYRYLITEAESRSEHLLDDSLDCFASLNDFLPDFYAGLGSILSVRGERILSSTKEDNFIVDDKITTDSKVPFLSLNLHTLAEQLAKLDPSKRLFIEAELLLPDLRADKSKVGTKHESAEVPKTCTEIADKTDSCCFPEKTNITDELPTSKAVSTETEVDTLLSSFAGSNLNNYLKSKAGPHDSVDDLLDETSLEKNQKDALVHQDVTSINIDDSIDDLLAETSMKMNQNCILVREDTNSISIDDSIDDLLEETSNNMSQKGTSQRGDEKSIFIDDSIDDLLAETSKPGNQFRVSQTWNGRNFLVEKNSAMASESVPKSKALADFDSWLDTI